MTIPAEHYTDTRINAVDFFKTEAMGRTRRYIIDLPRLDLEGGLVAQGVHAEFRLLRVGAGLLAEGTAQATVELECVRTLEPFPETVQTEFAEQFRPTVDVNTGRVIRYEDEEEFPEAFPITANHELDMEEPLRQVILVALPMQPIKPGTHEVQIDETDGEIADARPNPFAVLGALLQDDAG